VRVLPVLVLALVAGLTAQELIPGTARLLVSNLPEDTSGFICPMHPNEVKAEPGKCRICGMDLVAGNPMATADYELAMTTTPAVVKAGQPTTFRFTVRHPLSGAPVTDFAEVHDRLYHLFIVSRDLQHWYHEHPTREKDGSFTIRHTLPAPGHYVLYSDFLPIGGGPQLLATPLVTAGYENDLMSVEPALSPDASLTKVVDGVRVELRVDQSQLIATDETDIPVQFTDDATGAPITDLQRYLGAFGHAMMLSADMTEYVHAHPEEMLEGTSVTTGGGPGLVFHALFPKPGLYRIWLQFQRRDRLSTVPFTVRVSRLGEPAPAR
jgi:Heavy metal binding domain